MKKIIPYILITLIFANLFAPFSVGLEKNKIDVTKNVAHADPGINPIDFKNSFRFIKNTATPTGFTTNPTESKISLNSATYVDGQSESSPLEMYIKIDTGFPEGTNPSDVWYHVARKGGITLDDSFDDTKDFILKITDTSTGDSAWTDITNDLLKGQLANGIKYDYKDKNRLDKNMPTSFTIYPLIGTNRIKPIGNNGLKSLYQDTEYKFTIYYQATDEGRGWGDDILLDGDKNYYEIAETTFKTASKATGNIGSITGGTATLVKGAPDPMPECSLNPLAPKITGCVAQILYYVVFTPTSFLFALAGTFFDNTFAYSVQDSSYRSGFVVQGWGIVRDFCNMFFIFVLLYVAFATILDIHGFSTKQTIINVIIIGVLINFSLFAAQVIIDTSNILARVFYNSNTIKITQAGANGVTNNTPDLTVGTSGVLPLSAALVNKVNPQNLIINSQAVNDIPDKGGVANNQDSISASTFILITLLASAINIVGFIVFLSVGLMFVARVIGLWIAMIVVPLTFFTYMVPSMQGFSIVGWKKWWYETLSLAFLAPVFIFFLYLILKFLEAGLSIIDANGKTGLEFVVAIVIPFAFIMVLLMKAKDIAKKMSGEMGSAITGAATAVGGVALGLATGGAALAGKNIVGRLATVASKSEGLSNLAAGKTADGKGPRGSGLFSYGLQKAAIIGKKTVDAGAKGSFDFRQTGAANQFSKQMGMDLNKHTSLVGLDTKSNLGGYKAQEAEKIAKEEKFAKSLGSDHSQEHNIEVVIKQQKEKVEQAKAQKGQLEKQSSDLQHNSPQKPQKPTGFVTKEAQNKYDKDNQDYEAYQANLKNINNDILKKSEEIEDAEKEVEKSVAALKNVSGSRQKEYILYKRKQSGNIYDNVKRDDYGNIKSFGDPRSSGTQAAKQILKEFAEGLVTTGVIGAAAGSIAGPAGMLAGGLFMAVRNVVKYNPETNASIGDAHNAKPEKGEDKYKPGAPDAHGGGHGGGHDDHGHGGGHDDHGGGHDDHGGGGHH